jgi:hypothetical protein
VANKNEYIERLERAIHDRHGAVAIHLGTEAIVDTVRGQAVWEGKVEVFSITGHPEARICYAWSYQDGPVERFAVILGIPPIRTELDAVRAFVAAQVKKQKAN